MSRKARSEASRGSQKWLQILVNHSPRTLEDLLRPSLDLPENVLFEWLSPKMDDEYAEYNDDSFLKRLGTDLHRRSLDSFWPSNGPAWDGLCRTTRGDLILVEAKSHISEIISTSASATWPAVTLIRDSLMEARAFLGSNGTVDWSGAFYQHAKSLAHLYLLRELNRLPAYLVTVYFVGDEGFGGPTSVDEWKGAVEVVKAYLGVERTPLSKYTIDLFVDIRP